jgi:hypothetical protein
MVSPALIDNPPPGKTRVHGEGGSRTGLDARVEDGDHDVLLYIPTLRPITYRDTAWLPHTWSFYEKNIITNDRWLYWQQRLAEQRTLLRASRGGRADRRSGLRRCQNSARGVRMTSGPGAIRTAVVTRLKQSRLIQVE